MGLPNLTFQQLFEYLEQGEKDPYVEAALDMPGNRERLNRARRLYQLVKSGGSQDEGPSPAGSVESVSGFAFDSAPQSLKKEFVDISRTFPTEKGVTRKQNQSKGELQQAVQTMRRGGNRFRVSGTLRIKTVGAIPRLEYAPPPRHYASGKSSRESFDFGDVSSLESMPDQKLDLDVSSVMFRRAPRRDSDAQTKPPSKLPPSASVVRFSLRPLSVGCHVDLTPPQPLLALEIQDTRWNTPAKQLEILYVPEQGNICRVTTDLKGRASLPLPTQSGRLRFDCDPDVSVDIEIQE